MSLEDARPKSAESHSDQSPGSGQFTPSGFTSLAVLGRAIVVSLLIGTLLLGPHLAGLLPGSVRRNPAKWITAGMGLAYVVARWLAVRRRAGERLARVVRGVDSFGEGALAGGLDWFVGLTCLALLATWVPHYLTWPWFRDTDAFAMIAQSWDEGIVPYRDIQAYNFPGQVYIHWLLGKTVGWGRTAAFYAVDVSLILGLGATLVAWSRRRLDGPLPGLVGYLAFLAHYLSLEYSQVAQRDWQATCLVVLAVTAMQGWPGRAGRLSGALLAAAAFSFRPHVVLFLPALVSAVDENARRPGEPVGRTARALAEWSLVFLMEIIVAFAPLILAGVIPDFVGGLRTTAYGGPYSRNSPERALQALVEELGIGWTPYLVAVGPLLSIFGPPPMRRLGRTWGLAMLAVLAYKPLHPVQHLYLLRPLELISSVVVALCAAWVVSSRFLPRPIALVVVALVVCEAMPTIPKYCRLDESLRAFGPLWRGEEPRRPPPGAHNWFHPADVDHPYRWSNYCGVLSYLRSKTTPRTLVANVLRRFPFPPVNGPTGRLSPFLVESGVAWMWMVDQDLDASFAESLEHATDSVVVWCPNEIEPRLKLEQLTAVIRSCYHVEVRFGRIEIWRRTPEAADDRGIREE